MFNDTFLSTLDAHAPIKSIWIRSRPCPYLTTEIKDQMTFRDQLFRRYRESQNADAWKASKEARRSVKQLLKNAGCDHIHTSPITQSLPSVENNQYLYSIQRKEIKWLPLNEHLHYRDTIMTFRCMKGLAPTYLCESLRRRKSIHHHNTRNRESLDIPPSKTKSGQRRFLHRAVNIWNNLDKDFKQLSLTSFKKKLKMHMLGELF